MKETSKCYGFRKERGDFDRYLKGYGIDIGAGDDPLQIPDGLVVPFDVKDGDAALMESIPDQTYDFVYSSHCLEDMPDIEVALRNWVRIVKPGGFLYIVVPDFGLYEKFCFPSRGNPGHRNTFSTGITRQAVGRNSHHHIEDVKDLFFRIGVDLIWYRLEFYDYDFTILPHIDQTMGNAVAQICFIGVKR